MTIKRHLTHYADRTVLLKTRACHLSRKQKKKAKKIHLKHLIELAETCLLNITPLIYGDAEFKSYQ